MTAEVAVAAEGSPAFRLTARGTDRVPGTWPLCAAPGQTARFGRPRVRSVDGNELVPLPAPKACCGFATGCCRRMMSGLCEMSLLTCGSPVSATKTRRYTSTGSQAPPPVTVRTCGARRSESPIARSTTAGGLRQAWRRSWSVHRRGAEAQVSILGGSRTTWERAGTSQNAAFVVVDGTWRLPPRGPRSL
jgi:hypothetical protein